MSTKKEALFSPQDWISPAEAARIRGVSRQAISKLITSGRLGILSIGGRKLVRREDIKSFSPLRAGRPKKKSRIR